MFDKLLNWTPTKQQQWETIRLKGRRHYLIWRGMLWFGGFMFIFMTAWMSAFNLRGSRTTLLDFLVIVLINAIVWPIGGLIWGLWTWSLCESKFRRYQQQQIRHLGLLPSHSRADEVTTPHDLR